MRYTYFEIKNFKGIEHARLDLLKSPKTKIYTLVGLNESGKTTILEGINLLSYRENLDALDLPGYAEHDIHEVIPISKRSNFNDQIVIEAGFALDEVDQKNFREILKRDLDISITSPISPFYVRQSYAFRASRVIPDQPQTVWSLALYGRTPTQKRVKKIEGDIWQKAVAVIRPLLPRIVYFPNFLFEFPDKIYLESPPSEPEKHEFYCAVLQDVLDAIGEKTNLEEHILARAKSSAEFDKKSLDSVLLKMGGHITKTVFTNWNKIFRRPVGKKEIVILVDKDNRGAWYLQLRLKQDNEYYEISERSLGFRWFFAYLLLTQYRGFRREGPRNVVFLLDEPASNLHPSAQAQLLDSFASIPSGCDLIYTTHSHHMINPEWLEGAYVVKNEGLDYTQSDEDYTSRRTLITLHRYRDFAAKHPNQTTYFQPILDVLDYCPTKLENVPNVIMLEGKNDFYTLTFMQQLLGHKQKLNLMPGGGAGSLDSMIRLYLGWARNFIVLLDSDSEGEKQRKQYIDNFGPVVSQSIFTLGDIKPEWKGKAMEEIFVEADRLSIQSLIYPETTGFNKTHFARAIQELGLNKRTITLLSETNTNFTDLISSLREKLKD